MGSRLGLVGAYRRAGWHGLHPIIPPWAARELGGKCPGVLDGAGAWHPVGVQRAGFYSELEDRGHRLSHEARRAWGNGAGIGVNGRWFPAIDVDVLDEGAARALRGFLGDVFGEGCFLRVGRWPKFLMPFVLEAGVAGVRKQSWSVGGEGAGAIELLGWGQQWVAEGVHGGTGAGYRWLAEGAGGGGRPVVSRLPVLGLEALSELLEAMLRVAGGDGRRRVRVVERRGGAEAEAARPAEELAGPEDLCRELLRAWPNDRTVSYGMYVAVAHALKGACGGGAGAGVGAGVGGWDGFRLFSWWAGRHPRADGAKDARVWGSIRETRLGVEWLVGAVPGSDESEAVRRRRPGRGTGSGQVTAGVRAGWLARVVAWRLGAGVGGGAGTVDEEAA